MSLLGIAVEKPREIAVRLLCRYGEQADYLENLLEKELSSTALIPPDRGLLQELTFGVVRWQATLDWLIAQKTAGRAQKAALQILLQLGLYQIFWLKRIPDHAAVHETVEMAKRLGFASQAGFVNAVLRSYLREKEPTEKKLQELKQLQPALGYSHPEWLVERWLHRWGGEKARQLLDWNNIPPPLYARLNTLKTDPQKLTAQWEKEGVQFTPRHWAWTGKDLVYQLTSHVALLTLPSFQQGWFYIQDPSTLLAVQELDPQPGESVLDLCAAPGGKATFIAQRMQNQGHILGADISQARLDLVRQNNSRLGITCLQTNLLSNTVESKQHRPGFDRVLVDAPCSNTGVMRRRVDLRWRIRADEIERLHRTQLDLLKRAAMELKAGGTLVYSTCSLEPEENERVIQEFLIAEPRFESVCEQTLLPFITDTDGGYVARMIFRNDK